MHRTLLDTYISSQKQDPQEYHTASPLVDFVIELAQVNDSACEAVLTSGFLDMLLCMYICGFTDTVRVVPFHEAEQAQDSMFRDCSAALLALCRRLDFITVVSAHPVSVLWPKNREMLSLFSCQITQRFAVWIQLGHVMTTRRLQSLSRLHLPTMGETDCDLNRLADAWVDLVQFSR